MKFNDVFIEEFNSKTLEDRTNTAQELFSWDLNKPFLSYQEKGCNIAIFKADWSDKLFFVFEYEENIYVPTNVTATRYILNQIRQSDFEYWLKCVNEYS
ncbi:MAG TPA: hypothetical protein PLI61_13690, partial [bacterium]|nr:hypothetical protein [bacterium]